MPFRITTDVGNDTREHVVYTKQEIDSGRFFGNMDRRSRRLLDGDTSRISSNLDTAQDDIDELNNTKLPALDSRINDLEGKMSDLETSLANLSTSLQDLDTYLGDLDSNIDTLDGYFNDPSTIPSSYSFFEGIVVEQAWIDALVANQAWLDNLFVNDAYADRITANEIDAGTITSNEINVGELAASTAWIDEVIVNEAWIDTIINNNLWTDRLRANEISVADLTGISGTIASTHMQGDYLWAHKPSYGGSPDPTNLSEIGYRLDASTGEFYYDAVRDIIFAAEDSAGFGSGGAAATQLNNDWYYVEATSFDVNDSPVTLEKDVLVKKYIIPFGINTMTLRGSLRFTEDFNNTNNEAVLRFTFAGQTGEQIFDPSSSNQTVSIDLDMSSVTNGTEQVITVTIEATAADVTGADNTVSCELRRDFLITAHNN